MPPAPPTPAPSTRRPRARALAPRSNPFARDGSASSFAGAGAPSFLHPTQCLGYSTTAVDVPPPVPRDIARVRARLNVLRNAVDALHPPPTDNFDNRPQPGVWWSGVVSPPSYSPWPWPGSEIPGTQIARGAIATDQSARTTTNTTTLSSTMHRITPTSPQAAKVGAAAARRAHARVMTTSALLCASTLQTDTSQPNVPKETKQSKTRTTQQATTPPENASASLTVSSSSLDKRKGMGVRKSSDIHRSASRSVQQMSVQKQASSTRSESAATASTRSEKCEPTDTPVVTGANPLSTERSITDVSPSVDEVPRATSARGRGMRRREVSESSATIASAGISMPRDNIVEKTKQLQSPPSPPLKMPTSPHAAARSASGRGSLSPPTSISPPSGTMPRRRRPLRARRVLPPMQVRIVTSPTTPEAPSEGVQRRAELVRMLERDTTGKFSIGARANPASGSVTGGAEPSTDAGVTPSVTSGTASNTTDTGIAEQVSDPETGLALAFLACLSLAALVALIAMLN